jgi:thiamine phosphate synthase YjbQ (UPF0047 family)
VAGPSCPKSDYRHHRTGGTAATPISKSADRPPVILPITQGKLDLGPWQQLYYAEFDGRRRKRVIVKVIGE